ncbi:MAG TPA: CoA transferase [Candidatus Binataceae bacterium]|nr:CoA transferase [Candidatus Binataceae bacterium]
MPGGAALDGLRVLDLTDLKGALAGRLLADLGADVIKVEPLGGDSTRHIGPFADGRPHPDRSLCFWFYNLNKRSVTLDYNHARGADLLLRLAESADAVIESFEPGRLEQLGLAWEDLHERNPALILCSIAPFGQSGPYRDFAADDTVLSALSGMLYVNGFAGETPVRPLGLQAYHCAGYYGAISIMCALFARERGGHGQWIDLSMQEAAVCGVEHVAPSYFGLNQISRRRGTLHWAGGFRLGQCRDGYLLHSTSGDWTTLLEWVNGDGKAQDLTQPQWSEPAYRRANAAHLFDVLEDWARDQSCEAIAARAQTLRLPYAMPRSINDLLNDEQLKARGYFVEVEHPELGRKFLYPGAPYLLSATPWRLYRRPPLLGEHNKEVLAGELDLTVEEIAVLRAEGVC